jgi:hypothetical protein
MLVSQCQIIYNADNPIKILMYNVFFFMINDFVQLINNPVKVVF